MKIDIQSPGFTVNLELMGYIHEKVEKLSRYCGEIITSEISLRLENSDIKENKLCEIRLAIPGNDLFASSQCKTFEKAVSNAVEIIKEQLKRKKTKIIGTRNDISPQLL
ncbi:MAG: ribosome-associated translation inhibitor RaiA [Chitinophagaceae bacterium]|nr:ribosome-associated translation inhibitor RaiA [Chitinophagaceae bacterium]